MNPEPVGEPVFWQVARAEYLGEVYSELLDTGWEPFAVLPWSDDYDHEEVWFRRRMPPPSTSDGR